MTDKNKAILAWTLRLIAAIIMLQTLYFKFTAAEESVYIFSTLGMEPWGRIGTGILELTASILLFVPKTTLLGALLALGIMGGAILSHIFFLGIPVMGDNGQLFIYALLVFLSALGLLYLQRHDLPHLKQLILSGKVR
jgi:uncharacterized membrane protein YphA (DoxX/SURF4 family)